MKKKMCKGREKSRWKRILCVCLWIIGIIIPGAVSMAANPGSIRIEFRGRSEKDKEIILENTDFALYYVGSMQDGIWKTEGDFQNAGVSLEEESSSERNKQAEKLYTYALKEKIQGNMQSTNTMGIAEFSNLKSGLYLVSQIEEWKKSGIGSFHSAPFLVSIPGTIDGELVWNVVSKPKSEWGPYEEKDSIKPETQDKDVRPSKPNKVKTGDSAPIKLMLAILLSSTCLIWICLKNKKLQEF